MGRKSRLKKERRELIKTGFSNDISSKLISFEDYRKPIYRFFQEKWQADSLCDGNVWLSTLETCRKYENPEQGDPEEAQHTYHSGHITGSSNDPIFVELASRTGISIGPNASNITISNCRNIHKLPDAFVLCTTKKHNPAILCETFGNHCVRINNPLLFFQYISAQLHNHVTIEQGAMGSVKYAPRHYTGLQQSPGPIGFVKPTDQYSSQNEFRFLWIPSNSTNLLPFLIKVPEISKLCEIIV